VAVPAGESVRIKTDGATLAVRHFPGSGDPIVLLHGGPGMGDYFGSLPEVLSPPYSVVSYNQRGCGPSSCDGSFDVDKQVDDLDAIRRHFAADRIHLFGHSWGGLLGQLYAKTHPERVASLVLCCSMANTGRKVAAMESKAHHGSKVAWRATSRSIKALQDDYLDRLSITAPVLIVQGEHDVIRETNALLAARFPAATNVRIENSGHFPWVEEPAVFSRTVLDFYSRIASAASA